MWDVTLRGQPDWVTRFPDIRSNSSLGISGRVFLPRLTIVWVQSVKQIALPSVGRSHPTCWRPEERKRQDKGRLLCAGVEPRRWSSPALPLELIPRALLAPRPSDLDLCNKPPPVCTYPIDSVSLRTLWGRVDSPDWAQPAFGSHLCH